MTAQTSGCGPNSEARKRAAEGAVGGETDVLRETLIDFAEWRGDSTEDAEWAAETYLRERSNPATGSGS